MAPIPIIIQLNLEYLKVPFLVPYYFSDLESNIKSNIKFFADDN